MRLSDCRLRPISELYCSIYSHQQCSETRFPTSSLTLEMRLTAKVDLFGVPQEAFLEDSIGRQHRGDSRSYTTEGGGNREIDESCAVRLHDMGIMRSPRPVVEDNMHHHTGSSFKGIILTRREPTAPSDRYAKATAVVVSIKETVSQRGSAETTSLSDKEGRLQFELG